MSFKKSRDIFVWGMMALKFPGIFTSMFNEYSSACSSSTLNLKWSILVRPESARHITIQFRTAILSNLLKRFMYHLVFFFLSKGTVQEVALLDQLHPSFRCNLQLIQVSFVLSTFS